MKELPTLYDTEEECCGCTACYTVCSRNAISMQGDENGFFYPKINPERCVRCYMCTEVCPIKGTRRQTK